MHSDCSSADFMTVCRVNMVCIDLFSGGRTSVETNFANHCRLKENSGWKLRFGFWEACWKLPCLVQFIALNYCARLDGDIWRTVAPKIDRKCKKQWQKISLRIKSSIISQQVMMFLRGTFIPALFLWFASSKSVKEIQAPKLVLTPNFHC